ncbi:MAE_28990/MAE_18760 family HEPN-like nuclease [Erwinia billingiae]|uniref:MAE_28990/MAE_18760 family HEPN-like nuclease n=1 Tax=Erwinia billingiae TaxID=182337 RepID=UPI0012FF314B|nr:MAE_28990/MAE_18760 family HEPN-like nuclease [Erwinia billingiae]
MEIRTVDKLVRELSNELSWRTKEISHLRVEAKAKNGSLKDTILRSGVAITYCHWEGFIKIATELFLNYLNYQKILISDLQLVYVTHAMKKEIHSFSETKSVDACITFLNALFVRQSSVAEIKHENYVDTQSNLSSTVFDNIAKSIGIDTTPYKDYYPYIDENIVNARNDIAHGQKLMIDEKVFDQLADKVSNLLRMYKDDIENIVALKSYLLVSHQKVEPSNTQ